MGPCSFGPEKEGRVGHGQTYGQTSPVSSSKASEGYLWAKTCQQDRKAATATRKDHQPPHGGVLGAASTTSLARKANCAKNPTVVGGGQGLTSKDPVAEPPYPPESPAAVKNFWHLSLERGNPNTTSRALKANGVKSPTPVGGNRKESPKGFVSPVFMFGHSKPTHHAFKATSSNPAKLPLHRPIPVSYTHLTLPTN